MTRDEKAKAEPWDLPQRPAIPEAATTNPDRPQKPAAEEKSQHQRRRYAAMRLHSQVR